MTRQRDDQRRIEALRVRLKLPTKISVVRAAIRLLEERTAAAARTGRWRSVAERAAQSSRRVNAEFLAHSRLRRH